MDKHELVYELKKPFSFNDHEARKGSSGDYYIYVKKEAIINRLDKLFPLDWGTRIVSIERIGNRVEVSMEMQIEGITRSYNGVSEDNYNNKSQKSYPKDTQKAAVTDAFKRVATMFGVGLYLQRCGSYKASNEDEALNKFSKWYEKEYPGCGHDWHEKFIEWCKSVNVMGSDYSDAELMNALNLVLLTPTKFVDIKDIKQMPHDKDHAMCSIVAWKCGYDKNQIANVLNGFGIFTNERLVIVNSQIKNANLNLDKEVNFNG